MMIFREKEYEVTMNYEVFVSKVDSSKSHTKMNNPEVLGLINDLRDKGVSGERIQEVLNISKTAYEKLRKTLDKKDKTKLCLFTIHCLTVEHGMTIKEIAQAMDTYVSSIQRAQKRVIKDFDTKYSEWKEEHQRWRYSLRV